MGSKNISNNRLLKSAKRVNDYIMTLQYLNEVNEFDTFERSNNAMEFSKTLIHLYYFEKYPEELLSSYLPLQIQLILVLSLNEGSFERAFSSLKEENEMTRILKVIIKDFMKILKRNSYLMKNKEKIDSIKFLKEYEKKCIEEEEEEDNKNEGKKEDSILYLCSYVIYTKLPYTYTFEFTLKNESIYIINVISLILLYNDNDEILYRIDINREMNSFINKRNNDDNDAESDNIKIRLNIPYLKYKGCWIYQWRENIVNENEEEVMWSCINYKPIR